MNTELKGRVVIVTGSSQGMGRSCAELFAAEGARVAICARSEKKISSTAEEIRAKYNSEVHAAALDVTDSQSVEQFVTNVAQTWRRVDVCVANAGGPPAKNFLSITMDEWRKAVELCFLSVVSLAKAVIPYMQKNRWGRFISITSVSVKQPIPDLILSNAVRPAVVGLMKSLAMDFGKDNITFNNVGPGYTRTERLSSLAATRALAAGLSSEEIYREFAADIPLARLARPEEIADAVVWLASERAAYVTGQSLLVDGGKYKGL